MSEDCFNCEYEYTDGIHSRCYDCYMYETYGEIDECENNESIDNERKNKIRSILDD